MAVILNKFLSGVGIGAATLLYAGAAFAHAPEAGFTQNDDLRVSTPDLALIARAAPKAPQSRLVRVAEVAGEDNSSAIAWKDTYTRATSRTFVSEDRSIEPMLDAGSPQALELAIARYEIIVNQGGWPELSLREALSTGSRGPDVVALRRRLEMSGDISPNESKDRAKFDIKLDAGLRRFQVRHGLKADGVAGGKTAIELNVPASERLESLRANLVRVKALSTNLGNKYVVVNIPAAQAETVENGFVFSRHNVVVGMPDRATPIVASKISQLNFNPYWHVPVSIVEKDLLPQVRKNPNIFNEMNIRVYSGGYGGEEINPLKVDWSTVTPDQYLYRQEPGRHNAMASVKINFPNSHAVYLHDTPSKNLFGRAERFFSSGCVRVEGVPIMLEWLLKNDPEWTRERIDQMAVNNERVDANLKEPVPLRLIYLTAWAKRDGTVHFRNDLYGWDTQYAGHEPIDFQNVVAARSAPASTGSVDEARPAKRRDEFADYKGLTRNASDGATASNDDDFGEDDLGGGFVR